MPHLVLIDGPNYVFRAFHAIRNLSNAEGMPTNAVFGYVQMLRSIMRDLRPTHLAVAFDPEDGTFRNRLYPDYKAHRPPMPEELRAQWPWVFEVTRAFRAPLLMEDDYEADDIIATLTRQARERDWEVSIVSTDKDLMQLVSDKVWMVDTMKGVEYGPEEVRERWGVPPSKIRDLLALTGDSADNIPGVPGIGPKTAAQLIEQWGGLAEVLAHAAEIPQPKRRENLLRHAEAARLSWELIRLEDRVPLPVTLDDLAMQSPDAEKLAELFGKLGFRRLTEEFAGRSGETEAAAALDDRAAPERKDRIVDDEASLAALLEALRASELTAIDAETTSLHPHDARIVGLSFATRPGEAWYLPLAHEAPEEGVDAPSQLPAETALARLADWLADENAKKCGHNLKYDMQVLRGAGLALGGVRFDSMLLAYCLAPGRFPPKLDTVALHYLGHRCTAYEEVAGKGAKHVGFARVPLEKAAPYACEDAEVALRLSLELGERLRAEGRLARHDDIELPLSRVLAEMEWTGVRLDAPLLERLSARFGEQIARLEEEIHREAGEEFNIHSPKQLGEVLFEKLGLPGGKRTKSGQWATGQEVLERLAEQHPVPALVLRARALAKLKSTYADALVRLVHPETGRVHTSYNQAITSTGRLSSSDPNLQNIPVRTAEGREIRKAFIAGEGRVLIAADYSQIELRLMAHFSKDPVLLEAFRRGEDIHAATAAQVAGVPISEVDADMRRRAKIVNFGILYGMSAHGLAKQLGVSRGEAKAFLEAYFEKYSRVRAFMDETLARAREQGWVETLLGHRVPLPEINDRNAMRRAYAERTAINAPLQGSAADIIKVAMIRLHERLAAEAPDAAMVLQVHDELVVEAPADQEARVAGLMREEMENAVELDAPLVVDIGAGGNWFEAHKI